MKKEQFHKLDQLDRIEFILADNKRREGEGLVTFAMVRLFFIIIAFIFIMGMLFYIAFENLAILLLLEPLRKVFIWAVIFAVAIDIFIIWNNIKKRKQLDKFFLKRGGLKA